jgi:hypothetical protein
LLHFIGWHIFSIQIEVFNCCNEKYLFTFVFQPVARPKITPLGYYYCKKGHCGIDGYCSKKAPDYQRSKTSAFFSTDSLSCTQSKCISRKLGLMPCLKTILYCLALEHSAFKTKHLKMSYHGIRLNFSSDNPAFSPKY